MTTITQFIKDVLPQFEGIANNNYEGFADLLQDKYLKGQFIQNIDMMKKLTAADWNHIGFPIGVRIAMQEKWTPADSNTAALRQSDQVFDRARFMSFANPQNLTMDEIKPQDDTRVLEEAKFALQEKEKMQQQIEQLQKDMVEQKKMALERESMQLMIK